MECGLKAERRVAELLQIELVGLGGADELDPRLFESVLVVGLDEAEVHVTLIWVRGGEHPALNRQPLYNAKRLVNPPQRIAFNVANFDTGRDLPSGDIFVARVVLVVVGSGTPGVTARLVVAAGPEGVPIPAGLRVTERSPVLNPEIPRKPLDKPE